MAVHQSRLFPSCTIQNSHANLFYCRLLDFTLRLGTSNPQCFGTSKNDLDRDLKSILLLSSCSNGVHWAIVDLFRASDIIARDFRYCLSLLFS